MNLRNLVLMWVRPRPSSGSARPSSGVPESGQWVVCYNHEPPEVFSVEASLARDPRDDCCPICGRDDNLEYLLTDLDPESVREQLPLDEPGSGPAE